MPFPAIISLLVISTNKILLHVQIDPVSPQCCIFFCTLLHLYHSIYSFQILIFSPHSPLDGVDHLIRLFRIASSEPSSFVVCFVPRSNSLRSSSIFAVSPSGPRRRGIPSYFSSSSWDQRDAGIPSTKKRSGTAGIRTADPWSSKLLC